MKTLIMFAAFCMVASLIAAPAATAQCVNPAQPLAQLAGSTFGFKYEGFNPASFVPGVAGLPVSAAGKFTASIATDKAGNPYGLLSIIDTYSKGGAITRLETFTGKFQIFPDCSGGTFMFQSGSSGWEYDFWFVNGGTEIYFVGNDGGGSITGIAKKI